VTFTLGTTSSAVGDIVAFSGVDTTGGVKQDGTAGGPFDVAPVAILAQTSSGISAVGASTLTTVSANAAVLMCGMAGGTVTWANTGNWMIATGPQNLTEIADNHQATAGSVGVAWATKAAAGATGAGAVTLSGTARNGGILLALRPASGTPKWSGAIATFKPQPAALSGTLALGGTTAGDYTLAGAGGAATILALQLTVTAVSATKVYDGTLAAAGTPVLTPALATGDTTTALGQVFETKDAGEGNKVIVPNITIDDGNGGANYAVTPVNFPSGTIHKAAASITLGNLAQTYDGSPKAASASTVPIAPAVDLSYAGAASAPSAAASYAVGASANDLNYAGSTSGTLVIAAETIVAWRSGHFTADEITAGLAADAADADGDGLTNLTEYTLGSDPRAFTSQPLVLTRAADDSLNLTFVARRAAGAGYAGTTRKYVVESTADLTHPAAWQGVAGFTDIVGDDQTITVPVPGGQPGRFCRLNVRLE
jgi:hypothetical protein